MKYELIKRVGRHAIRDPRTGRFIARAAGRLAMRNPYIALGSAAALGGYNLYNSWRQSQNNYNDINRVPRPIRQQQLQLPSPMGYTSNTKTQRIQLKYKRSMSMMPPVAGKIKMSKGLTIGKRKKMSMRQQIESIRNPPIRFDSKWTFQMDTFSGRVTAAQIPILSHALVNPITAQLFANATTDTTVANAQMTNSISYNVQYRAMITDYKSHLQFYNSSSNLARCRLVWYRPKNDMQSNIQVDTGGANIPSEPINTLMYASNAAALLASPIPQSYFVGDGITFDYATAGANISSNYDHAGWPVTSGATTTGNTANVVAQLDPALVPGSNEVRSYHSRWWREVKSQDFVIEPGMQFNTTLRMRNRIVKPHDPNQGIKYYKDFSCVGVLYVLGQIVFDNTIGQATSQTISTGSAQISCIRNDTCYMRPDTIKRSLRCNLTPNLLQLAAGSQGIVNTETGDVDLIFSSDA